MNKYIISFFVFFSLFLASNISHATSDLATSLSNDPLWRGVYNDEMNFGRVTPSEAEAILDSYLEKGADINAANDDGYTALIMLVGTRQDELAQLFLKKGADPNKADANGVSPLMYAALHGRKDMAASLLEYGADINAANEQRRTALMHAVMGRAIDTLIFLLESGANIDKRDMYGETALFKAADNGDGEICRILLERGANPDISAGNTYTPLMVAAYNSPAYVVKILLDGGSDPTILPKGQDLQYVTVKNPEKKQILQLLGVYEIIDMPKHYSINELYMKNARAKGKEFSGDKFVDILFLEQSLRPFKSSQWPHPITHHSMKVGYIVEENGNKLMSTYDLQIFNEGTSLNDYRFLAPMSGSDTVIVRYKK